MRHEKPFRLLAIAVSITLVVLLSATLTGVNGLAAWVNSQDGDSCVAALSGDQVITGQWVEDCASENRNGSYARYYSFALEADSEVTITLESEIDTWLYLLEGAGRTGEVQYDNDDIVSGNFDSQIKETLAAGSYTIEATTYAPGKTGNFTLTVSGLGPGEPPQALIGTASVNGMPVPAGTSITAWDGDKQIGSAQASEGGEYTLLVARSAGPITFKIGNLAADQTYPSWVMGDISRGFDLTATDTCRQAFTGDGAITGQWVEDCASENRNGSYARYYSFALEADSEVTVTLESEIDTWLYLLEGAGRTGEVQYDNDDIVSGNFDSQIKETLAAGSYTIEATTYTPGKTGSFTLTVSGLGTAPPTINSDRDVLVAFYNATDGPNWKNSAKWLTDAPIEEWYGVSTDGAGRVTGLATSFNQLSGELPSALGNLANLEELDLAENRLTGAIPSELGNLSNLEELTLASNQLTGAIPSELGSLSNLTVLTLASNQLTGAIPSELGSLSNLTVLTLASNQLTGAIPSELGNLANLEELTLSGNLFTGCIPEGLRNVPDNDFTPLGLPFCGPDTTGNSFALMATGGAGEVTLTWADQAGINVWQVRWRAEDELYFGWINYPQVIISDGSGTDRVHPITGLVNAKRFCFQVRAFESNTPGPRSNEACAITAATPEQADDFAATAGIGQVTLTWDNPTDDTITEWQYRYTTADSFAHSDMWKDIPRSNADTVSYTVDNLDSGKKYTFEVRALAHDTPGEAAEPDSTGSNVVTLEPGPPVGLEAESGDEQVTLSWADQDDDGIYKWQYKHKEGSGEFGDWIDVFVAGAGENPTDAATRAATAAATSVVVGNLTNGVGYSFQVQAVATPDPTTVVVNAAARTVTAPNTPDVPGPAASAAHFLEIPTAATAVEGGIPNQTVALGQRLELVLSVFFVDGQGAGAIDGYHVNVSPSNGPLFAYFSSAGVLTMIGLNEGVAVVQVTAIDGYDSNGSGDVADDDPSVVFIVTVRGN